MTLSTARASSAPTVAARADVNNTFYGSPGGGGRIALYYGGSVAPSLRVTAFGGTKGVAAQAGAGTVFLKNVLTSQSVLLHR
jgi:hypothetical protein